MSIEKERKAFEEWLKETNKTLYNFSQEFIDDDSTESLCLQWAWTAWNASLNREGYKLVPVEPTKEMYLSGYDCKVENGSTIDIYKTMIGAIE